MEIKQLLKTTAIFFALGAFGQGVFAESSTGLEDAVTKADEAAEEAAKAAETKAEAAVARDKKLAEEGKELQAEEISGDMQSD